MISFGIESCFRSDVYKRQVYNSNPANVAPAQRQVLEGLLREDLFTVVHERFMTDTAKYADIILPADMSVEHGDIVTPYGALCVQKIAPVVSPPGECKSNWDTFILLAAAMGYDDAVSYTHLDVYKRQPLCRKIFRNIRRIRGRGYCYSLCE